MPYYLLILIMQYINCVKYGNILYACNNYMANMSNTKDMFEIPPHYKCHFYNMQYIDWEDKLYSTII